MSEHPDLIFANGAVYTVDAARRWAQAAAVRDGRIVAVGADDEVRGLAGPATEVVDLAGGMLLPGFQDAHVHPVSGGLDMLRCDLHDLDGAEAYVEAVRAYAQTHPDVPWILGGGWSMDAFPGGTPAKELLDAVVADRPVFLPNRDGHSAWVNSAALRLAGITRDTPDPADGRIERTADGEPQGTLHEGAASLVERHVPPPSEEDLREGLRRGQAYLHSLGITAWQDAIVDVAGDFGNLPAYLAAAREGWLTARVVGALWWDRHRGLEQIDELVERRALGPVGRFRPTSVKIMQDGVCENFTAAVLEPYLDADGHPTDNRGISFVEPGLLREAVTRLDALGFQVHFHALGDRAVREALDAIEAAREANGWTDGRHHLAHIQIVDPQDVPRFRRLGAVANAQPLWAAHEAQMDELTIPFLGEPRWRHQYPFASLVRHGATLAMGSDWSVSSPNPLEEIHVAVNRRMPPSYPYRVEVDEPFLPAERLDLPTALAAFTMGSAYVNHLERETGSIEVGKLADLVVLDRNLFEHPVTEIAEARVLRTYVEGELVWAAEDVASA
ncbi:MAG: amidohydrolase [Actinomycetota bacterium]|jgi:predicted amidohydrolase YtcJ|nr:MAG: amidohydrolase [Actinomycetota bacterium]